MTEIMSIAVSDDDQWLVVNGRPVEYYASDKAFVEGRKVWAAERAAVRLGEALASDVSVVDFVSSGFPDAIVTLPGSDRKLVHGLVSLEQLGLQASDPNELQEEDLVILARELISRAQSGGTGVESAPEMTPASA